MTTRSEERAGNRQVWEQHIRNWKESGLAQSEYGRRHNLKEYQLTLLEKKVSSCRRADFTGGASTGHEFPIQGFSKQSPLTCNCLRSIPHRSRAGV